MMKIQHISSLCRYTKTGRDARTTRIFRYKGEMGRWGDGGMGRWGQGDKGMGSRGE